MRYTGKWLVACALAALVAGVAGCGPKVEIVNPFAKIEASPLETALASSKAAIELGAEWYTDACVLRLPGLAVGRDVCATYYADVHPALRTAQNRAVEAAARAAGTDPLLKAAISVDGARRTFVDFAGRYGFAAETWARGITLALGTLTQKLRAAAQGGDA